MLKGFKEFIMRGNIVELAVAVVVGTAFVDLVTIFTNSIINPLIASFGGSSNVGLAIQLVDGNPKSVLDFGAVINGAVTFLLTAAVVYFLVVLPFNKIQARIKARRGIPQQEEPPSDNELLIEIRDLLKAQANH
ncbi:MULTISPECIES: large conductance mechanosensitive channel protein MscL [Thermocrispum]|jgi:large conductance mechanosensitive channel|uniref:large conductance mechanosensitive channel protein MscL n=1 Tax=Thermocrispum TaxID=37924 RepID=UPI0003F8AF01|nr:MULTISPECIES: large conductance mechanosensitive channel protein MscL [Thermocrispum]